MSEEISEAQEPKNDDAMKAAAQKNNAEALADDATEQATEQVSETSAQNDYEPAAFKDLEKKTNQLTTTDANLEVILDIPVTLSMEIGRTELPISSLLQLNQGSVVELDRLAGEPMDVLINGTLIAHGEVVVINEKFGIRLTDVISPAERVQKLK